MSIPDTIYMSEKGFTESKHMAQAQNLSHGNDEPPIEYRRVGECEWLSSDNFDGLKHIDCTSTNTTNYNSKMKFCPYCGNKIRVES